MRAKDKRRKDGLNIIFRRGDHKQPDKRKPIAAKLIAGMLEVSGVQQVITVDIHSPQTEGFFSIPVDCLTARFLFERWVIESHCHTFLRIHSILTNFTEHDSPSSEQVVRRREGQLEEM